MRVAYLYTGIVLAILEFFNLPRLLWIAPEQFGPVGIFRGFAHGMVGFTYMFTWTCLLGGVYMVLLGVLYWDMDTRESRRWQFTLEGLGTARLLWILGAAAILLGIYCAIYIYSNDNSWYTAGLASTVWAWLTCWAFWLAFPLYEQVGIDRDEVKF